MLPSVYDSVEMVIVYHTSFKFSNKEQCREANKITTKLLKKQKFLLLKRDLKYI